MYCQNNKVTENTHIQFTYEIREKRFSLITRGGEVKKNSPDARRTTRLISESRSKIADGRATAADKALGSCGPETTPSVAASLPRRKLVWPSRFRSTAGTGIGFYFGPPRNNGRGYKVINGCGSLSSRYRCGCGEGVCDSGRSHDA